MKEELSNHLTDERIEKTEFDKSRSELSESELNQRYSNRRNGYTSKTIKTGVSDFELNTPRDRDNTFEPNIVRKNQTILTEELDNKILSLYSLGMSYRDISKHIEEMYGIENEGWMLENLMLTSKFDNLCPNVCRRKYLKV